MADEPTTQQTISDDQELAKVLAGVNGAAEDPGAVPAVPDVADPAAVAAPAPTDEAAAAEPADAQPVEEPAPVVPDIAPMAAPSSDLDNIKVEALNELRPLVDKLDLPAEEKFDTYLLLLRSTDDRDLIAPAHEAAKSIADEARKAQALLDIIKEIDFLSQNQK